MSGLYIKGMEMPEPGEHRLILYVDKNGSAHIEGLSREYVGEPFDVIPVPDHGRLIDVDALAAEMKDRQDAAEKWLREAKNREIAVRADGILSFLCELKLTLDKAPTVLPADKEAPT